MIRKLSLTAWIFIALALGIAIGILFPAFGVQLTPISNIFLRLTELGEVISGSRPGRSTIEEVTVYKSTGIAVEDAAAAGLVYQRALREGAGTQVDL